MVLVKHSCNCIFFCNRLKTLKKEISVAEEKAHDRKKKKDVEKASAAKPKRLSRYQYPFVIYPLGSGLRYSILCPLGGGVRYIMSPWWWGKVYYVPLVVG